MKMFENRTIERIEEMLDSAMDGTFCENDYDESKLSRLESKWKKYLYSSQILLPLSVFITACKESA